MIPFIWFNFRWSLVIPIMFRSIDIRATDNKRILGNAYVPLFFQCNASNRSSWSIKLSKDINMVMSLSCWSMRRSTKYMRTAIFVKCQQLIKTTTGAETIIYLMTTVLRLRLPKCQLFHSCHTHLLEMRRAVSQWLTDLKDVYVCLNIWNQTLAVNYTLCAVAKYDCHATETEFHFSRRPLAFESSGQKSLGR